MIEVYADGENTPAGFAELVAGFETMWSQLTVRDRPSFEFKANLKNEPSASLPRLIGRITQIRNPDLYFVHRASQVELGGVEITTHSPDGSNVDKRYPYLWVSRRVGMNAFVAMPYQKRRPTGQVNRFPYRHSERNLRFLSEWQPEAANGQRYLQQLVPLRDLQVGSLNTVAETVRSKLLGWHSIGSFFAAFLLKEIGGQSERQAANTQLRLIKEELTSLATACLENTGRHEPSSLLKLPDRWIQVYNTRPESGHWERGEGQFDSIDGRLMFTLDEIGLLPPAARPRRFEFWLPQIVSRHPWMVEQLERGYGSKRFRNIMVALAEQCHTKFADQLVAADWHILHEHRELLLERLDWEPAVYSVADNVRRDDRLGVATSGLEEMSEDVIKDIERLLADATLFFSSHRAYLPDWEQSLSHSLQKLPSGSRVLVPRIPGKMLAKHKRLTDNRICGAEDCSKVELMMLRQIHRNVGHRLRKG